jgi:hypothetical protein
LKSEQQQEKDAKIERGGKIRHLTEKKTIAKT